MMKDGIRIGEMHSYHNFDLYIKSRNISLPEKKNIRETVPFMNGYYDFSALSGSPAWGERSVEYVFDLIAETPSALDEYVSNVLDWLGNVHDEDIFDDTMPNYHWHGSYDSSSIEWEESGLQAEIAITFACYPFKIANDLTSMTLEAGTHTVNNPGMDVAPFAQSDVSMAIQIGSNVSGVPGGTAVKLEIDLKRGDNTVIVTGDGTLELTYYKEVL